MGKSHQSIAGQMKTELEEPLSAFAGAMKERRKIVQGGIEKVLKVKMQQSVVVNKVMHLGTLREDSDDYRRVIGTSKNVSRSRAIWLKAIWLWVKKNGRTRPN